jgi:peptidyl-lysine (3S)-dioxygenase / protease
MSNNDEPFRILSQEARELYLEKTISRIQVPSALVFYRDYVSRNRPVIIENALNQWPALSKWQNSDYLRQQLANTLVTIDVTPDGYGDCVKLHKYFVTPLEEKMQFNYFMDIIEGKTLFNGIVYCQHQNSSFTTEFQQLNDDINELDWVREAFGSFVCSITNGILFHLYAIVSIACNSGYSPDAVNLWIGTSKSISTLHHDPYENLYGVIRGRKYFTLYPPTDLYWLDQKTFVKAHYERHHSHESSLDDDGENLQIDDNFRLVPDQGHVPWFDHSELQFEHDTHVNPLKVTVEPGELLYLPSLWFHRVEQDCPMTIACNFWYDMHFDIKWNYYQFMSSVIRQRRIVHKST